MTAQTDSTLDRLRRAHEQVQPPSEEVRKAARQRVVAATASAEVSSEVPATPAPERSWTSPGRAPRRRRLRLGLPAIGLATALAGAAAVLVAVLPQDASRRLGPAGLDLAAAAEQRCAAPATTAAASAACLNALGAVAGDWQLPGRGDVLYQRFWWGTSAMHMGPDGPNSAKWNDPDFFLVQRGAETELWLRPDGSGESLQLPEGEPALPSARDRERWIAAGRPSLEAPGDGARTGDELAMQGPGSARRTWSAIDRRSNDRPADLFPVGETNDPQGRPALLKSGDPAKEFSTDPAVLRAQIRRFAWTQRIELSGEPRCALDLHDCRPGTKRNILSNEGVVAVALLGYPAASRELRAATLEAMAAMPGYRTIGEAEDARGRRGFAVELPAGANDGQNMLLIDPASARLIAVGSSDDGTLRAIRWSKLFNLAVARVEDVGERP